VIIKGLNWKALVITDCKCTANIICSLSLDGIYLLLKDIVVEDRWREN
jgi:hypothetical protein